MSKEEIGSANLKTFKVKLAEKFNLSNKEVNLFLSISCGINWNNAVCGDRSCKSYFDDIELLEKLCNLGFLIAISPRIYGFQPLGYELFKKYNEVPNDILIEISDIEI